MANHLIHRQILQLRYSNAAQAKADLNDWGERFQKILQPAMEEVLEEVDLPNQTLRIQKLEVDLGKVPASLDPDLIFQKVKDAFKTQIQKEIPDLFQPQPLSKKLQTFESGGARDELQDLELLLFLLEFGRNPWWKSSLEKTGIRVLLQKLLREKNPNLKSLAAKKSLSSTQLQRLLNHTEYSELFDLGNWVFPQQGKVWELFLNSLEQSFPEKILSNAIWQKAKSQLLLEFFFAQKNQKSLSLSLWTEEFLDPIPSQKIPVGQISEPIIWSIENGLSIPISSNSLDRIWENWITSRFIKNHSEVSKPASLRTLSKQLEELKRKLDFQHLKNKIIPIPKTSKVLDGIPKDLDLEETYPILNAGLVLVAPFLPYFFKGLGLLENKKFVSQEAQNRAALLLQCLLEKEEAFEESELLLNKLLCGISPGEIIPVEITLSEVEKEEIPNLLAAMVAQWTALKSTSGESMAKGFFPREGILKKVEKGYELKIPRISIDILLNRLPWAISIIKLPWMQETLYVEW